MIRTILFLSAYAICLLAPTAFLGMWPLFWVFFAFFIVLGISEAVSIFRTGETVTQNTEATIKKSKLAWIAAIGMVAFSIFLVGHFYWRW